MMTVNLILLATLAVVFLMDGMIISTVWASIPLLASAVLTEFTLSSSDGNWAKVVPTMRFGLIGLIVGVVALTLYSHVTLFFGLGNEGEGPRQSSIIYMVAPVYAFLGGGVGFVLGYLFGRRIEAVMGQSRSQQDQTQNLDRPSGPQ
jgi:hypothetical protein